MDSRIRKLERDAMLWGGPEVKLQAAIAKKRTCPNFKPKELLPCITLVLDGYNGHFILLMFYGSTRHQAILCSRDDRNRSNEIRYFAAGIGMRNDKTYSETLIKGTGAGY